MSLEGNRNMRTLGESPVEKSCMTVRQQADQERPRKLGIKPGESPKKQAIFWSSSHDPA